MYHLGLAETSLWKSKNFGWCGFKRISGKSKCKSTDEDEDEDKF